VAEALVHDGWEVSVTGWPDVVAPPGARELAAEDLADPAAPARLLDAAGPVHAIVLAHAHSDAGGLLETSADQIDRHLAVNVRGSALLLAEFTRRFDGDDGRIVVFTSNPPLVGEVAYAASKGAVEWLALAAAAELAPRGIAVNAVDPGPTDNGWMSAALRRRLLAESPSGRLSRPPDAAALVCFLCSDAGGWIRGQVLRSDGGWSTLRTGRRGGNVTE
jgi:3-oxoacyl-[acyl-carrier protein] reductase